MEITGAYLDGMVIAFTFVGLLRLSDVRKRVLFHRDAFEGREQPWWGPPLIAVSYVLGWAAATAIGGTVLSALFAGMIWIWKHVF